MQLPCVFGAKRISVSWIPVLEAARGWEMAKALMVFSVSGNQVQQPSWEWSVHAHQPHLQKCCCAIWKAWPSLLPDSFPRLCQTTCQQGVRMLQKSVTRQTPQPKSAQPAAGKVGAEEAQREGSMTNQSGIAPGNLQQKRFCGLPHFFQELLRGADALLLLTDL